MNWNQFLLSLAAVYLFYYALNVIFDLMFRSGKLPGAEDKGQELTFFENNLPEQITADTETATQHQTQVPPNARQAISSGLLQTTGAVGIKQLFALAHADLIEYTKAIPY